MSLFLLGFLLKGSQKLDCQLLICLFAADNKGINYFHIKTELLLFLIALGLRLPHFTYTPEGINTNEISNNDLFERKILKQNRSRSILRESFRQILRIQLKLTHQKQFSRQ